MSSAVRVLQTGVLSAVMVLAFGSAAMASTTHNPNNHGNRGNHGNHHGNHHGHGHHGNHHGHGHHGNHHGNVFWNWDDRDECWGERGGRGRNHDRGGRFEWNHQEQYGLINLGLNGIL